MGAPRDKSREPLRGSKLSDHQMSRGATLIELIVAMTLLAIVAAGVFGLYAVGVFANQHAADLAGAAELAQARLEQLITNPFDPQIAGNAGGDLAGALEYRWNAGVATVAPGLGQGTVTVAWTRGGRHYEVTLTTLVRMTEAP
jgi:prepilin-type N-terminal cleavage/methylation domain-containing protein